jgi:hypothetical protein
MFLTCAQGHDLTAPDAYLYQNNGNRDCRLCSPRAPRKKPSGSTWHEKRATFA